jgi:soluble lytic murein transglycosylase-like protein
VPFRLCNRNPRADCGVRRIRRRSDPAHHRCRQNVEGRGSFQDEFKAGRQRPEDRQRDEADRQRTNQKYASLIKKAAAKHGVPVKIAKAVVQVESNFNPRARGSAGEVGLMQIKPATARGLGYRGSTKALYNPETNLEWGMMYLAGAHKRANGDLCGTILRYNAGHFAKRMNPVSKRYCSKVKRILASS